MANDRSGWKGGRFSVDYETASIYKGLRDWQRWTGDFIYYFRFEYDQSSNDAVYGEADSPMGRVYFEPNNIPALHVNHTVMDNDSDVNGFYYNSTSHVTLSFDQLTRLGLNRLDIDTQNYLKDRFVYKQKVFRVTEMQILGKLQQRDIIVSIDATQVKPDEMVNDLQFAMYATPNTANTADNFETQWNLNNATYDPYNTGQGVFPLGYNGPESPADLSKQMKQVSPTLFDNPNG